jgi:hypothetical protein
MTRLWAGGLLVTVPKGDKPSSFRWQGRVHTIQGVAAHWHVDVGWWRLRIWREYFKVSTTSGLLVILYHDLVTDEWYLQRVHD